MFSPVKQPSKQIYVFFAKREKSDNFSSTSTGREKLIDLSNKLQDELLKGITNLIVIQYHSNGYYKPYTLQGQRELENRKSKEHRTENNEAKSSALVKWDRRSKWQKSNGNRSNECILFGNKTFRKDSNLYRLRETERVELFPRTKKFNMHAVFIKVSIFDKPDIYVQLILWVTGSAWIGNFISLKLLSITFHNN